MSDPKNADAVVTEQPPAGYFIAPQPPAKNGFAIASLILAFFFSPLGLLFGILGIVRAGKVGVGKALAWVGTILSILSLAVGIAITALVLPTVLKATDAGCIAAKESITKYDPIFAKEQDPKKLVGHFNAAAAELDAAAAKADDDATRQAVKTLAADYRDLAGIVEKGTEPPADLESRLERHGAAIDSACGTIGS
ncbi:DUF4190 domain-containing protein [Streptomyces sp. NPDC058864]